MDYIIYFLIIFYYIYRGMSIVSMSIVSMPINLMRKKTACAFNDSYCGHFFFFFFFFFFLLKQLPSNFHADVIKIR